MKIRTGFVSNSSTTSFAIAGICLTSKEFKDIFGDVDLYDEFYEILPAQAALEYQDPDYGPFYIGYDISLMRDDETKKEFFNRTLEMLKKLMGSKMNTTLEKRISFHHDGWYDG